MAANFTLTLDTTAPAGADFQINGGASYATSRAVTVHPITSDASTTGYQVKVWGDVDTTVNANIQATEAASAWISWADIAVTLAAGDGAKTLNVRLRDDVWNQTGVVTHTITLDTTVPVITLGANSPDVAKVSEVAGKDTANFNFSSDSHLQAWKVCVVPNANSTQDQGTTIGTTNGSTNMTGGALAASTTVNSSIKGADLAAASAGDGAKVIKVFGQDDAGNWSV